MYFAYTVPLSCRDGLFESRKSDWASEMEYVLFVKNAQGFPVATLRNEYITLEIRRPVLTFSDNLKTIQEGDLPSL